MRNTILSFFFFSLLLFSCKSTSKTCCKNHDKLAEETAYIEIGNYGGFTGEKESYAMYSDGAVVKFYTGDSIYQYATIAAEDAITLFAHYDEMKLIKYKSNTEGNLTFYIIYKKGKNLNTIKWESTEKIDIKVQKVYQSLYEKMQQLQFVETLEDY